MNAWVGLGLCSYVMWNCFILGTECGEPLTTSTHQPTPKIDLKFDRHFSTVRPQHTHSQSHLYVVSEHGIPCLVVGFEATFEIYYLDQHNEVVMATLDTGAQPSVSGVCMGRDTSGHIVLSWPTESVQLDITFAQSETMWRATALTLQYNLSHVSPPALIGGPKNVTIQKKMFAAPIGQSYECESQERVVVNTRDLVTHRLMFMHVVVQPYNVSGATNVSQCAEDLAWTSRTNEIHVVVYVVVGFALAFVVMATVAMVKITGVCTTYQRIT